MKKLQKFVKIGLPIIGSAVVAGAAVAAIALTSSHASSIKTNLTKLNQELKEEGFTKNLDNDLPSITSKWGQIALMPTYSKTVMDKFGAVYTPDGANTKPWPRLIANGVSEAKIKNGTVAKEDLLTFEQLIPNVLLARLIAEDTLDIPSYETVLTWIPEDPDHPESGGRWSNRLAEKYHPLTEWNDPDYRTEFNARATFYSAVNNDSSSQTTCSNVDQLLSAVLMNPWIYDSNAYNIGLNFEPAYSHVYNWDLSNNFFTTLPRGMFKYVNLTDTDKEEYQVWEQYGFALVLERNNLCVFNPLQLFGDRLQKDDESWDDRGADNNQFKCNVVLNLSKTLINAHQNSWLKYAAQKTSNTMVSTSKYGWNFAPTAEHKDLVIINSDLPGEYYQTETYDSDGFPQIGPSSRYDDGDPLNYGLATGSEELTYVVMSELTNNYSKANIWASNEIANIVQNTLDCIVDLNLISVPEDAGDDSITAKGSSDDLNGTCTINLNATTPSPYVDIATEVDITGFNETKSGLILSICLTVIFLLVLLFAVNKVYRNFHPKLTKDELKDIREINSANRLNRIRRTAEERASKEEAIASAGEKHV